MSAWQSLKAEVLMRLLRGRWDAEPLVDSYVVPPAETLDEKAVDRLTEQVNSLEVETRSALQQSQGAMSLAVAVGAIAVALAGGQGVDPGVMDILWLLLPLLLGVAAVYNLNTGAQVAAMAELRDRLAKRANKGANSPHLLIRLVEDNRRGSRGTIAGYALAAVILSAALVGGILHAIGRGSTALVVLQFAVTVLVLGAILLAGADFAGTRWLVNCALDQVFPEDRPLTAPPAQREPSFWRRLKEGITVGRRSRAAESTTDT